MNTQMSPAILIVEDEAVVAKDLQQTLAAFGYDAFAIASSAEQALERAAEKRPDLVLMDIRIDGPLDGIQTADILRDRFHVPIVYLTAHADEAMVERAKGTEPYGYLLKPVQDAELRRVISITLYKRKLEDARERSTELDLQRQALQEANRLKDEFLVMMSHELHTPLNGIIGFAELLHDGMAGPITEKHREYLGHVLTSGRRFLQVINDVLDLARMEAGKIDFHPAAVDLSQMVNDVIDVLRTPLDEKALHLKFEAHSACTSVVNDPSMLKQILYNYLSNAIKFTPAGGTVTIRVRPEDTNMFRVEVADTGIGISQDDVGRLFVAFQQLDSGIRRKFQGPGLGLAITKRIAAAQGGRVGFERVAAGGSMFFVVLPRALGIP